MNQNSFKHACFCCYWKCLWFLFRGITRIYSSRRVGEWWLLCLCVDIIFDLLVLLLQYCLLVKKFRTIVFFLPLLFVTHSRIRGRLSFVLVLPGYRFVRYFLFSSVQGFAVEYILQLINPGYCAWRWADDAVFLLVCHVLRTMILTDVSSTPWLWTAIWAHLWSASQLYFMYLFVAWTLLLSIYYVRLHQLPEKGLIAGSLPIRCRLGSVCMNTILDVFVSTFA